MPSYPRSQIVDETQVGLYHCINRCVRRAHLCGFDRVTKMNYDHRKEWIKTRIEELKEVFAVDVASFAIMDNHIHLLLRNRPDLVMRMSDDQVLNRWWNLFPKKACDPIVKAKIFEEWKAREGFVATRRLRLSSISWYMRCLTEPIARRANKEDSVTGRFWEGRFVSKRVLDAESALATSVYIDLNPMKAGLAKTVAESSFTSGEERAKKVATGKISNLLVPIRELLTRFEDEAPYLLESEAEYIDYLKGMFNLWQTDCREYRRKQNLVARYYIVIGTDESAKKEAERMKKKWLKKRPQS